LAPLSRTEERLALSTDERVGPLLSDSSDLRDHAWRALYDDQFDRVYRLACRFGVPASEIEDVAQQVFLVAYRRIGEVKEIANLAAWLRGIAVKVIADHHRWQRVRRMKQWMVNGIYARSPAEQVTPARGAEDAQLHEQIGAVLRRMSPKLRAVLVLCDIEECSLGEVSEALRIPINTVRSRRRLARDSFRRMWADGAGR
jgi:RNA polymerase sigma-70 factor (ECF subfamily)